MLSPVAPSGTFDQCLLRVWPQSAERSVGLYTVVRAGGVGATIAQLNPSLGETFDVDAVYDDRVTRHAPALAAAGGVLLAGAWIASRRRELLTIRSLAVGVAALALQVLLEALCLAFAAAPIAAVGVIASVGWATAPVAAVDFGLRCTAAVAAGWALAAPLGSLTLRPGSLARVASSPRPSHMVVKQGGVGMVAKVLLAVLCITMAACNGPTSSADDDPWRPVLEDAAENASNDFERDVLADLEVSRAEYEDAYGRLAECMENAGYTVDLQDAGGLITVGVSPGGPESEADFSRCADGTTTLIAAVYNDIAQNPQNVDYEQLIVDCLIDNELVDPDFTTGDLAEMLEQGEPDPDMVECLSDPDA